MRHCAPIAIGPALTGGAMTPDAISGTGMQQTDPRGPGLHHQRLATRHTFVWVRVHLVWSTYRRHPWIEPTWQERRSEERRVGKGCRSRWSAEHVRKEEWRI